jgi:hypothetical protein
MNLRAVAVALAGVALIAAPAHAHVMPAGQGSSRIDKNHAYTMIALPVSVVHGFDDDHDGRMSDAEARAHADDIGAQLKRLVHLSDADVPETIVLQNFTLEQPGDTLLTTFATLTLVRISEWKDPVGSLRIAADVFPGAAKDSILFRAVRGDSTETAYLKSGSDAHAFFVAHASSPVAPVVFGVLITLCVALGLGHVVVSRRIPVRAS